jgi:hypothetical protein
LYLRNHAEIQRIGIAFRYKRREEDVGCVAF